MISSIIDFGRSLVIEYDYGCIRAVSSCCAGLFSTRGLAAPAVSRSAGLKIRLSGVTQVH